MWLWACTASVKLGLLPFDVFKMEKSEEGYIHFITLLLLFS